MHLCKILVGVRVSSKGESGHRVCGDYVPLEEGRDLMKEASASSNGEA
jgi:hypothetical protein